MVCVIFILIVSIYGDGDGVLALDMYGRYGKSMEERDG